MSLATTSNGFDRGQRRQAIVESLLADVFGGQLRPGQHLVTQDLAVRFGVSHTPIREALIALAGVGVIDLLPNRGALVRRVTAKDVREVCQVRRILECEATRRACGRIALRALAAGSMTFGRRECSRTPVSRWTVRENHRRPRKRPGTEARQRRRRGGRAGS